MWSALCKDVRQNCLSSVVREMSLWYKVFLDLLSREDDGKGRKPSFPQLCKRLLDIPCVKLQLLQKFSQFCLVSTFMLVVHTVRIVRSITYFIRILQHYDTQG